MSHSPYHLGPNPTKHCEMVEFRYFGVCYFTELLVSEFIAKDGYYYYLPK